MIEVKYTVKISFKYIVWYNLNLLLQLLDKQLKIWDIFCFVYLGDKVDMAHQMFLFQILILI